MVRNSAERIQATVTLATAVSDSNYQVIDINIILFPCVNTSCAYWVIR